MCLGTIHLWHHNIFEIFDNPCPSYYASLLFSPSIKRRHYFRLTPPHPPSKKSKKLSILQIFTVFGVFKFIFDFINIMFYNIHAVLPRLLLNCTRNKVQILRCGKWSCLTSNFLKSEKVKMFFCNPFYGSIKNEKNFINLPISLTQSLEY